MKQIVYCGFTLALSLALIPKNTLAIDLSTSSSTNNLGDTVNVDLSIDNLGDGTAPSVSAFNLDVSYDESILEFQSLVFGDQLSLSETNSFQESSVMMPNLVNLLEVSLNSPQELDMGQESDFILATLTFNTVGAGTSNITPSINILGDANGNPLTVDSINSGLVTVQTTNPVPFEFSPSLGVFLTASWLGFKYVRRKSV